MKPSERIEEIWHKRIDALPREKTSDWVDWELAKSIIDYLDERWRIERE